MNEEHKQFLAHLQEHDPRLAKVVSDHGPLPWPEQRPHLEALLRAIVGQQVSTQAAKTIFWRFMELFPSASLSPESLTAMTYEQLRSVGLSNQKTLYVKAVAEAWLQSPNVYSKLDSLSQEEVIQSLTAIKGVGVWTAQMFLMFTLRRQDVFAPGDLGLKKAMANLYGLAMNSPERAFSSVAARWSPYRSLASLHLWHSLNPNQPK